MKLLAIYFSIVYSTRQSSSAKGNAILGAPNDPRNPGELIVNFPPFCK